MSNVNQAPLAGQEPVLTFSNPEVASAWLSGLREHIEQAEAASSDQLLPSRERQLGHTAAAHILQDAFLSIHKALLFAERSLHPTRSTP